MRAPKLAPTAKALDRAVLLHMCCQVLKGTRRLGSSCDCCTSAGWRALLPVTGLSPVSNATRVSVEAVAAAAHHK